MGLSRVKGKLRGECLNEKRILNCCLDNIKGEVQGEMKEAARDVSVRLQWTRVICPLQMPTLLIAVLKLSIAFTGCKKDEQKPATENNQSNGKNISERPGVGADITGTKRLAT
jgi:hypothetical protein